MQHAAQLVLGLGVVGFDPQGRLEFVHRVVQITEAGEHCAQIIVGVRRIRLAPQRFGVLPRGFLQVVLRDQQVAHIIMGVRIIRTDAQGPLIIVRGGGEVALPRVEQPDVIKETSKLGQMLEGFVEFRQGFIGLPEIVQRQAEIIMGNGVTGRHRERVTEQGQVILQVRT